MKDLMRFTFEGFDIESITKDGEPWFVLGRVCAALGGVNVTDAKARLDPDEWAEFVTDERRGQRRSIIIVSDSGLYSTIMQSRSKKAKKFQKWVTKEVLPDIRKHGGYISKDATAEQIAVLERQLKAEKKNSDTLQGYCNRLTTTCGQHTVYDYCVLQKNMKLSYDQVQQIDWIALDISSKEGTPFPTARHFDNEPVMIFRTHVLDRAIKLWKVNYK